MNNSFPGKRILSKIKEEVRMRKQKLGVHCEATFKSQDIVMKTEYKSKGDNTRTADGTSYFIFNQEHVKDRPM